jgi:hypothetical protein
MGDKNLDNLLTSFLGHTRQPSSRRQWATPCSAKVWIHKLAPHPDWPLARESRVSANRSRSEEPGEPLTEPPAPLPADGHSQQHLRHHDYKLLSSACEPKGASLPWRVLHERKPAKHDGHQEVPLVLVAPAGLEHLVDPVDEHVWRVLARQPINLQLAALLGTGTGKEPCTADEARGGRAGWDPGEARILENLSVAMSAAPMPPLRPLAGLSSKSFHKPQAIMAR